ncbi:uncharacterized protein B0H18DRAFT_354549 [Fomitopsis serialis]|uniref:uncharacterized protein n=1 Tax=Fomitopsis serialis TaxID=139415 RepID=UPI002008E510|nr:uncharacterized protein B0H18DRAFT_354549 [Neoantrodia serialis]KAH9911580.1 hypothetical protein B0H18DRAFT_354549 [Neoantrodia serialis]
MSLLPTRFRGLIAPVFTSGVLDVTHLFGAATRTSFDRCGYSGVHQYRGRTQQRNDRVWRCVLPRPNWSLSPGTQIYSSPLRRYSEGQRGLGVCHLFDEYGTTTILDFLPLGHSESACLLSGKRHVCFCVVAPPAVTSDRIYASYRRTRVEREASLPPTVSAHGRAVFQRINSTRHAFAHHFHCVLAQTEFLSVSRRALRSIQ